MALTDILASLLSKAGGKKDEKALCERAILEHEERIRDLNDRRMEQMESVKTLEDRIRHLKAEYNAASPAAKRLYEAQIRSLMKDYARAQEMMELTLRNVEKEKQLLQNRRLQQQHLLYPTDENAIEDAIDRKEEIVEDLHSEDALMEELEGKTYRRGEEDETATATAQQTDEQRQASLEKDLAALLGEEKPGKDPETEKDVSESGLDIA